MAAPNLGRFPLYSTPDQPFVFPTHWDDYGIRPRSAALKQVATFVTEVQAASPATQVIVPEYFKPTELR